MKTMNADLVGNNLASKGGAMRHYLFYFLAILITACAPEMGVNQQDAATSGTYDGQWVGDISDTAKFQRIGSWEVTCKEVNAKFQFEISNGKGVGWLDNTKMPEFYVSQDGLFQVSLNSDYKINVTPVSDLGMSQPEITFVLKGRLTEDNLKGKFIVGVRQLGNQGCTTKIVFKKIKSKAAADLPIPPSRSIEPDAIASISNPFEKQLFAAAIQPLLTNKSIRKWTYNNRAYAGT